MDAGSGLPDIAPATVTAAPLVVRFALGMPRFSARLLAMDDWGRRRRDAGAVDVGAGVEEARDADGLSGGEVAYVSEACLGPSVFFFSLRGASLISPASLRWWSSSRFRMRRAYGAQSAYTRSKLGDLTSALWVS